jgi:hypothetical protein
MGVQPPSDELDEGPEVVEFGIAALDAQLEEIDSLSFPAERSHLQQEYGDITVPVDASGHEIQLDQVLAEVDETSFESRRELLNALHPVFEQRREQTSRSLLAQLRALVPF